MSLVLDLVIDRLKKASPDEFLSFASTLAEHLSNAQLFVIKELAARELEHRSVPGQGAATKWGISGRVGV